MARIRIVSFHGLILVCMMSVNIKDLYKQVRARTMEIVAPLEIEDYVIQTAEFMSPPRWHIGHTSWFFETVLQAHRPGYNVYSEDFLCYFNSYYEGFGARIERPKRGTKSRPTVRETVAYRNHIDEQMLEFLDSADESALFLVRMGLEHEMQHQELLVYDIKHLLCDQFEPQMKPLPRPSTKVEGMAEVEGGLFWLGYEGNDFSWDNEKPAHQVFIQDFADRSGAGHERRVSRVYSRRWLSKLSLVVLRRLGNRQTRTMARAALLGTSRRRVDDSRLFRSCTQPKAEKTIPFLTSVSYEASAFAKWAGKRLPTEAEWERRRVMMRSAKLSIAFPWGDTDPDSGKANLFENGFWSVAPVGAFPEGANQLRLPADDWRRLGVDDFRLRAVSRVQVGV